MSSSLSELKTRFGLFLTEEGYSVCQQEIIAARGVVVPGGTEHKEKEPGIQQVYDWAIQRSLKGIAEGALPSDRNSTMVLPGLRLLQVVSARNASAPETRQTDAITHTRLLDILVTDGVGRCHAVEVSPISEL